MHSKLFATLVTIGLASTTAACSKDSDACGQLTAEVAKRTGAPADKVAPLVKKELTGPDGAPLPADQASAACKMIVSDKDVLEGYTNAIKAQLK